MFPQPEHSVYGILRQGWGFVKGNGRCTVLLLIGLFICWFLPNSKTMQEKSPPDLEECSLRCDPSHRLHHTDEPGSAVFILPVLNTSFE